MIDIDVSKIVSEIGEPKARLIESEEEKRQKILIIIFSAVFLFIFVAGTITFWILLSKTKVYASQLSSDVERLKVENSELLDVERRAFSVRKRNQSALTIMRNNANWSYVFGELEKVTPTTVTFSKLDVESEDTLRITATSPDYGTLSKFLVSMENSEMFKNVRLSGASLLVTEAKISVEFIMLFGFTQDISRHNLNPLVAPEEVPEQPIVPIEEEVIEEEEGEGIEEGEGAEEIEGEEGEEREVIEEEQEKLPVL